MPSARGFSLRGEWGWLLLPLAIVLLGFAVLLIEWTHGAAILVLAGMMVGLVAIRVLMWRRRRERADADRLEQAAFASDLHRLLSTHPVEFERLVGSLLASSGYSDVQMTKASGDQGVDLYCTDQSGRACVVQCKRYALHNHVSGPAMRDLIGAADLARADRALFVTTSTFTRDAVNNAQQAGIEIELIDGSALVALARQVRATVGYSAMDGSQDGQTKTGRFSRLERVLAAVAGALILAGVVGSAIATHETTNAVAPPVAVPTEAITTTVTTASSSEPMSSVEAAGAIKVSDQAVRSSPYVAVVVKLFTTYFDGINTRDVGSAASVFAPNGYLGVDHRARLRSTAAATTTTHDDDVAITAITPAVVDGGPGLDVRVNFRSRQSAKQGFDGQTCSLWSLNYQLEKVGTAYGLLGPTGNPHPASCD